jgi:hypothetical protein
MRRDGGSELSHWFNSREDHRMITVIAIIALATISAIVFQPDGQAGDPLDGPPYSPPTEDYYYGA